MNLDNLNLGLDFRNITPKDNELTHNVVVLSNYEGPPGSHSAVGRIVIRCGHIHLRWIDNRRLELRAKSLPHVRHEMSIPLVFRLPIVDMRFKDLYSFEAILFGFKHELKLSLEQDYDPAEGGQLVGDYVQVKDYVYDGPWTHPELLTKILGWRVDVHMNIPNEDASYWQPVGPFEQNDDYGDCANSDNG